MSTHYSLKRIAIFASGTGSNATKIVAYFKNHASISVALVVSNKATAPVLQMATANHISTLLINRTSFYESEQLLEELARNQIDFIVLAGFLWLIPPYLVKSFEGQMVNIHPALLPKYGGKGMYGMNVHKAIQENGEKESGITIHFVNEQYDEGGVIFQATCGIESTDTPTAIRNNVLQLEHYYFPRIIEGLLR